VMGHKLTYLFCRTPLILMSAHPVLEGPMIKFGLGLGFNVPTNKQRLTGTQIKLNLGHRMPRRRARPGPDPATPVPFRLPLLPFSTMTGDVCHTSLRTAARRPDSDVQVQTCTPGGRSSYYQHQCQWLRSAGPTRMFKFG
jgi:hypothetical protein